MNMIEFRSDTMTLPTSKMRDAMRDALLGDDVCDEDPTVSKLQIMAAKILGTEAALFVPSGTFGNQCAIGVHTKPGDEIIVSETSHIIIHEAGGAAALWGVQTRTLTPQSNSYITARDIALRIRNAPNDVHIPKTGLIIIENSLANGTVMPVAQMKTIKKLAGEHAISVHLDGARLFNAALSLNVDAREIVSHVDSVTFCLSKGLGAPVGSILCGTSDFICKAKHLRKRLGGGMRQVGVLAAPAIIAIKDGVKRLKEDHDNATLLSNLLSQIDGIEIDLNTVQSNMVFLRVNKQGKTEDQLVQYLSKHSINTYKPDYWGIRFVTSSRVSEKDVLTLVKVTSNYMAF